MTGRGFFCSILGREVQEEGTEEAAGRLQITQITLQNAALQGGESGWFWLGFFFLPLETRWGGPSRVVMGKREEKEIHPFRLGRKQDVLGVERADRPMGRG